MILEKITGSVAVFDTLPDRNEKITYDLLRLIKDGKPVILMSDRKTRIAAQTNADLPVWIFLKSMPDDRLSAELCSINLLCCRGKSRSSRPVGRTVYKSGA